MSEGQGRPGWHGAWQPAVGCWYGKAKPRRLRRVAKDQYRLVSALPAGGFVSIPIGRCDFDLGPPFRQR